MIIEDALHQEVYDSDRINRLKEHGGSYKPAVFFFCTGLTELETDIYAAGGRDTYGTTGTDFQTRGGLLVLEAGDYVLATKWGDGDPKDQWAVGFFERKLDDRFIIVDSEGTPFRANGFRRVKKISEARGDWLLKHKEQIEMGARSLWWWARQPMDKPVLETVQGYNAKEGLTKDGENNDVPV